MKGTDPAIIEADAGGKYGLFKKRVDISIMVIDDAIDVMGYDK